MIDVLSSLNRKADGTLTNQQQTNVSHQNVPLRQSRAQKMKEMKMDRLRQDWVHVNKPNEKSNTLQAPLSNSRGGGRRRTRSASQANINFSTSDLNVAHNKTDPDAVKRFIYEKYEGGGLQDGKHRRRGSRLQRREFMKQASLIRGKSLSKQDSTLLMDNDSGNDDVKDVKQQQQLSSPPPSQQQQQKHDELKTPPKSKTKKWENNINWQDFTERMQISASKSSLLSNQSGDGKDFPRSAFTTPNVRRGGISVPPQNSSLSADVRPLRDRSQSRLRLMQPPQTESNIEPNANPFSPRRSRASVHVGRTRSDVPNSYVLPHNSQQISVLEQNIKSLHARMRLYDSQLKRFEHLADTRSLHDDLYRQYIDSRKQNEQKFIQIEKNLALLIDRERSMRNDLRHLTMKRSVSSSENNISLRSKITQYFVTGLVTLLGLIFGPFSYLMALWRRNKYIIVEEVPTPNNLAKNHQRNNNNNNNINGGNSSSNNNSNVKGFAKSLRQRAS